MTPVMEISAGSDEVTEDVNPGSPADQTKWSLGWSMKRIPDPTNGQSLVQLDFLGEGCRVQYVVFLLEVCEG